MQPRLGTGFPLASKKGDKKDEHDPDESDHDTEKQAAIKRKKEEDKKVRTSAQKPAEDDEANDS